MHVLERNVYFYFCLFFHVAFFSGIKKKCNGQGMHLLLQYWWLFSCLRPGRNWKNQEASLLIFQFVKPCRRWMNLSTSTKTAIVGIVPKNEAEICIKRLSGTTFLALIKLPKYFNRFFELAAGKIAKTLVCLSIFYNCVWILFHYFFVKKEAFSRFIIIIKRCMIHAHFGL